ncbi:MAG: PHP domain-containing protein [Actinomycetota bacterium]
MRVDMHVHSNRSDGSDDPADVVGVAKKAGLDAFALTDHDTLAGLPIARAAAAHLGLTVYTGCEISAVHEGCPVHVLGYFMDESHPRLLNELSAIREDRVRRAKAIVDKLNGLGVSITYERVREIAQGESVGRPHLAAAMVEAGVINKTNEAFTDEWIGNNGRAYVEKKALSPQAAVDLINESSGAAVIAHPIWFRKGEDGLPADLIESLARNGLAGLEVNHPDHDEAARARFGALARDLGLIETGSSDYHGNEHGPTIALNVTPAESIEALRERRGRKRSAG